MTLRRGVHARHGPGWGGLAGILLNCLTAPLSAQLPTDVTVQTQTVTSRAEIDLAIASSRFQLGPVRLSPEISIRELTYDNNVYGSIDNPQGDFRAVVSAGVGLILPVTPNIFVRAGIFPAYTWYAELTERRFFGGTTGASVLVFANRLTIEGSVDGAREDVIFSTEEQGRVIRNLATARLGAEYRLFTRLFVYGEGQIQRFRFTGPGAESASFDPSTTDRTTRVVRAGLGYRWSEEVSVAVGYEETRAEFVYAPQQYDNSTKAIIGTISYNQPKLKLSISGGYREGEPIHGSSIPPFSGVTGSGSASYSLFRNLDLQAVAGRNLSYGVSSPYYISTRYGGGIVLNVGWRLKIQGFGYGGSDEYTTPTELPDGQLVNRKDDVSGYGGGFDFLFTPRIQMRFSGTESRYNSNVPGYDRSFFRWFVSLNLGGNLLQ